MEDELICEVIASVLGVPVSRITRMSRLTEDLGATALDLMMILTNLERVTGLDLNASRTVGLYSPADIADRVANAFSGKR